MRIEQYAYNLGFRITENGEILNHKAQQISGNVGANGYNRISIRVTDKTKQLYVHRLQALQKYGNELYNPGIEVRHKNGIKTDNSWGNILIGTHSDNIMDIPEAIRMATSLRAASFNRKHDKDKIRKFHINNGLSYKKTMHQFGITSKGTLHYILNK